MPIKQTKYHTLEYANNEWVLITPNGAPSICWVKPSVQLGDKGVPHICSNLCPMFECSPIDIELREELSVVVKLHCKQGKPRILDCDIAPPKEVKIIPDEKGNERQLKAAMNT